MRSSDDWTESTWRPGQAFPHGTYGFEYTGEGDGIQDAETAFDHGITDFQ